MRRKDQGKPNSELLPYLHHHLACGLALRFCLKLSLTPFIFIPKYHNWRQTQPRQAVAVVLIY